MSWGGLGSVRFAIEGLERHPPHQRAHVAAADFQTLLAEHVAQHATAGERVVQVQLVDAPHKKQIGVRDGARMVVDRGATHLQLFSLLGYR